MAAAMAAAIPAVSAKAAMPCESVAPVTRGPVPIVAVAMIPAMVPAAPAVIVIIERVIDRIVECVRRSAIIRLRRASGQEKTDADQDWYRLRHYSAAIHRRLHSYEVRRFIVIGDLHLVVDVHVVRCVAFSVAQDACTSHLLLVRREGACQVVRLPCWAFEPCL